MSWEYVVATLIFMVIGYLIGSVCFAIIFSKIFRHEDIRTKGSGNAGATNATRTYGKKAGLIVALLDIAKTVLAIAIAFTVQKYSNVALLSDFSLQFVGLAVVVGHMWPVFFGFRGGKGASTFVGLIISFQWVLVFLGIICFFSIVGKTKKVSLGSIITPPILILANVIFIFVPSMNDSWSAILVNPVPSWHSPLVLTLAWLLLVFQHRSNIKRLLSKSEADLSAAPIKK